MDEQKLESPESRQERIRELQSNIQALKEQLQSPNSTIYHVMASSKKDVILKWAEWLEELHDLGVYKEPKTTISNYIKKEIRKMHLPDKKELSIIHYVHETLPVKYINPHLSHRDGVENPRDLASDLLRHDDSFLLAALQNFRLYHKRFVEIAKIYENHLKDPETHSDFTKLVEWQEIAQFCNALNECTQQFGILDQMLDEGNVRQSVTQFQLAMYELLGADTSFRKWASKFGISPRQFQRIRSREKNPRSEKEEWKKKDPIQIIKATIGSVQCPNCSFNLISNRIHDDLTDDRIIEKFAFAGRKYKIPQSIRKKMQKKNLNPIEVAHLIWGKKIKPLEEKDVPVEQPES